MPRPHLTLFFDLHSPYSYLAFYVLHVSISRTTSIPITITIAGLS